MNPIFKYYGWLKGRPVIHFVHIIVYAVIVAGSFVLGKDYEPMLWIGIALLNLHMLSAWRYDNFLLTLQKTRLLLTKYYNK